MALFAAAHHSFDRVAAGEMYDGLRAQKTDREEILEVIQLVPQERVQERIVEEIIDVLVPEEMEKTVEVGMHIRQEGMQSCTVEQIVGGPCPQTQKEIRKGDTAHSARTHF